ncbi:MAG: ATP-binding cassette domain-containing protein [Alphaproteobacteria bacterium GM202ARS2]|nr:ATP-binding cassette domain-containing protein [Alphaproteobacteria bacterium GM202ARS2]
MACVTLKDVSLCVGGTQVLEGVCGTLEKKACVALLGANGAGKTLLLRLIYGLLLPSGGTLIKDKGLRQTFVFAKPALLQNISALQNILFVLHLCNYPAHLRQTRAYDALAVAGLESYATANAGVLSSGQAQRLAIARAWAVSPQLLLLDEPTTHLDEASTQRTEALIQQCHAQGCAILFSTHDKEQATRLGQTIWQLQHKNLYIYPAP